VESNSIRNEAIPILLKFNNADLVHNTHIDSINKWVGMTRTFIKDNPNILFTRADKGNTTVVLDKDEYTHKMEAMLSDSDTYTKISKDPTNKLTTGMRTLLMRWKKSDYIDARIYRNLLVTVHYIHLLHTYIRYFITIFRNILATFRIVSI